MDLNKLAAVIVTLGKIEVSGKENLSRLLGCINTLEAELEKQKEAAANETDKQQRKDA